MRISGVLLPALLALPLLATAASDRQELAQALTSRPDRERGAALYQQCVGCHGADGGGQLSGSVPRIAGQHYRVIVRQIFDYRANRRRDMRMADIAKSHRILSRPQDVADVALYVSGLDRSGPRGVGHGDDLELGAALYASKCAACHGRDGDGDPGKDVPRVGGQHSGYLMRQIYDAVDGRRPPLTRSHRGRLAPLTFDEVLALTDFVSRLGAPQASPPKR